MDPLAQTLFIAGLLVALGVLTFALLALVDRWRQWRIERDERIWWEMREAMDEARALAELQAVYEERARDAELEILWMLPAYGGKER